MTESDDGWVCIGDEVGRLTFGQRWEPRHDEVVECPGLEAGPMVQVANIGRELERFNNPLAGLSHLMHQCATAGLATSVGVEGNHDR